MTGTTLIQLHRQAPDMVEVARLQQRVEEIRMSKQIAYAPVATAIK